jgi:hypothetical protein
MHSSRTLIQIKLFRIQVKAQWLATGLTRLDYCYPRCNNVLILRTASNAVDPIIVIIRFDGLTIMNQSLKGAAKRLICSLLAATSLAGCAIYEPGYAGRYAPYDPYPYGSAAYTGVPYYVGPPVSIGLQFESRSGGHHGHHDGHRGRWNGWRH